MFVLLCAFFLFLFSCSCSCFVFRLFVEKSQEKKVLFFNQKGKGSAGVSLDILWKYYCIENIIGHSCRPSTLLLIVLWGKKRDVARRRQEGKPRKKDASCIALFSMFFIYHISGTASITWNTRVDVVVLSCCFLCIFLRLCNAPRTAIQYIPGMILRGGWMGGVIFASLFLLFLFFLCVFFSFLFFWWVCGMMATLSIVKSVVVLLLLLLVGRGRRCNDVCPSSLTNVFLTGSYLIGRCIPPHFGGGRGGRGGGGAVERKHAWMASTPFVFLTCWHLCVLLFSSSC